MRSMLALLVMAFWCDPALAGHQQVLPLTEEAEREDLRPQSIAVLRTLDKVTARITELVVPVGDKVTFGTLEIYPRYCRTRPPIEPPESFVYLEIDDVGLRETAVRHRVFEGWMVASSPALNPLEHSVYDVWVIDCRTKEPEASSGNR